MSHELELPALSPESSGVLVLRFAGGRLSVMAEAGRVLLDAAPIRPGEERSVAPHATVQVGGARLSLAQDSVGEAPVDSEATEHPEEVSLEFLPRGGRLHMRWRGQSMSTYLGDRRCDLAAVLLQPPRPHRPGQMLPDELIRARVWPNMQRSRNDLNTLVYRLRRTLSRMNPAAAGLVARAPGGRGTCLRVGAATRIAVR